MVDALTIRTLGGLTIRQGESTAPVRLETRTTEALLVYLACQGRPVERDILAELFWPERTQHQARTNLRVALHRLRQQLGRYLLTTRQNLAIHPDAPLTLDCVQFEAQLATRTWADATARYTGDFLAGFYLDSSPAFEQWMLLERERLHTLAVAAYQQFIEHQTVNRQIDTAIGAARRLLQLDPLHEPTHRQLMRLLAQAGQRNAALAQFNTCCQLLRTELDAQPDEMTTALHEQIRIGELGQTTGEPVDKLSSVVPLFGRSSVSQHPIPTQVHNLPAQSTPFLGREVELAQIDTLLANPDCRLLSILGAGGMGKTRLAMAAATRQLEHFADGIYFVSLAAVGAAEFMLTAVAESLNLGLGPGEIRPQIAAHIHARQLLLVLDNFEHLLDVAEEIAWLLRHTPQLKVLVTTRTRLQLVEEWLLPLDGFKVGDTLLGPAAQLFLRSAQRVQPTFLATAQEESITAICRQVGGMPLAIELAASWVRMMSCVEIVRQLTHNFDLLSTTVRNLPERHRNLRTLFDQSWSLLSPSEQKVLRRLSIFQGGWTLEEAITITETTITILLALVDKSLVRSNGQDRYDLHELVRQYAAEQLSVSGEWESIHQRHFATYLTLVRMADQQLRGAAAIPWFHRLETEQSNVRAALRWALDQKQYADVAWMGIALHHFWRYRARTHEAVAWLEPAFAHSTNWPLELRLVSLLTLYISAIWQQNPSVPIYGTELWQLAYACKNKLLRAHILYISGLCSTDTNQAINTYVEAIALLRQGEAIDDLGAEFCVFREKSLLLTELLMRHGATLRSRGAYVEAKTVLEESLAVFGKQEHHDAAYTLGDLGRLALIHGDLAQAQSLLGKTIALMQAIDSTLGIAEWQPYLAVVKLYQGKTDEAWQLLHPCLTLCQTIKNARLSRLPFAIAAMTALQEDNLGQAEAFLYESLIRCHYRDWIRPELVDSLFTAARLATAQQQLERAASLFGFAERLRAEIKHGLDAPMRPLVADALAAVRGALPPAIFDAAFATGQQLSLDQARATILVPPTYQS